MGMKMKKAIIIGGSNGIGLAIAKNLTNRGMFVIILDVVEPDAKVLDNTLYEYHHFNMLDIEEDYLEVLANDNDLSVLMITAGIGRVAAFECLSNIEIQKVLQINTLSTIKVVHMFYDRIKGKDKFYCGVMGSIAGLISSPLFSVYAASKAAVCRFIESINIELEKAGTNNRVLNVSPISIQGTRFNGGKNDLDALQDLANDIVMHLLSSATMYIPQYNEVVKSIIDRYNDDPHKFGLESYDYKTNSGRVCNMKNCKIGYMSGTFDLFHVGHLNLIRRAKEQCDYLIVGVHPSAAHKGKETFIPFEERKQIVAACKYVDKVVQSCPEDSDAWALYHYDKLFVGSDYKGTERFNRYEEYFKDKNVEIVYFPYTQSTSSTQIRKTILMKTKDI